MPSADARAAEGVEGGDGAAGDVDMGGPEPHRVWLLVKAQALLFRRFAKTLAPYKYAGYPMVLEARGLSSLLWAVISAVDVRARPPLAQHSDFLKEPLSTSPHDARPLPVPLPFPLPLAQAIDVVLTQHSGAAKTAAEAVAESKGTTITAAAAAEGVAGVASHVSRWWVGLDWAWGWSFLAMATELLFLTCLSSPLNGAQLLRDGGGVRLAQLIGRCLSPVAADRRQRQDTGDTVRIANAVAHHTVAVTRSAMTARLLWPHHVCSPSQPPNPADSAPRRRCHPPLQLACSSTRCIRLLGSARHLRGGRSH